MKSGLKGIQAVDTSISHIDGEKGLLIYRGTEIRELLANYSFEELAFFLWNGVLPNQHEIRNLQSEFRKYRELPSYLTDIIAALPTQIDLMSVIRTAVSASILPDQNSKPNLIQAIALTAMVPSMIAYRVRLLENKEYVKPRDELSHVANYLYMLTGDIPSDVHTAALEAYMILTMEHSLNASTFSARVTVSTESDMTSAITSAIGTMRGPLHGGAPTGVIDLLNQIGVKENTDAIIKDKLTKGEKLMGFGHRVYKTLDPRAIALKTKLEEISEEDQWLDLALYVEKRTIELLDFYKPGRSLYTNVEFYAAAIMRTLGFKPEWFTPTFTASRMVGWTAHVIEQAENNSLFRPDAKYIGKWPETIHY